MSESPAAPAPAPVPPPSASPSAAAPRVRTGLLTAGAIGALVSVGLGVYGGLHEPSNFVFYLPLFTDGAPAKSWLATLAVLLAVVQLVSALVMYGRLPRITAPSWTGTLHRWSGRVAVLVSVPVAVHCLYALGFRYGEPRVLVHSVAGCFFYGAFVAKMLLLRRSGAPAWTLPVLGGAVFTALVVLWLTSAVWFFSANGLVI